MRDEAQLSHNSSFSILQAPLCYSAWNGIWMTTLHWIFDTTFIDQLPVWHESDILSWRYLWIKLCVDSRARADGEGNHARRRNKKARDFTHPFIHKSTLLSIVFVSWQRNILGVILGRLLCSSRYNPEARHAFGCTYCISKFIKLLHLIYDMAMHLLRYWGQQRAFHAGASGTIEPTASKVLNIQSVSRVTC